MTDSSGMIGRNVGTYRIVGTLGRGGMGVVYKAQDVVLGRFAAVKFLPEDLATSPQSAARFVREAQAAASLNHPNIVTIYGTGKDPAGHYIAMEYVEGHSLAEYVKRQGAMQPKQALEIIRQAADALLELHRHRIVHRDIKPDNIMLDRAGRVRLMDFGLAWAGGEYTRLTSTGTTMGTPQYMSPEQWMDSRVDERSDLYSLGIVFFELLSGQAPFVASTPVALMRKIVEGPSPSLAEANVNADAGISEMVARMIAKKPEDRFQSAQELLDAIARYRERLEQAARGASDFLAPGAELMLERFDREAHAAHEETHERLHVVRETKQAVERAEAKSSQKQNLIVGVAIAAVLVMAVVAGVAVRAAVKTPAGFNSTLFPKEQFVWIEPGTFQMGSPESEPGHKDVETLHTVTLTKGFWMCKYEVTQAQWQDIMGDNPASFPAPDRPVESVSWDEANAFIAALNRKEGMDFRLPTEAEWEYACRAGSQDAFGAGLNPEDFWNAENSDQETHPVGLSRPNAWGLYDMHGNVWEWCQDWVAAYPVGSVTDPRVDTGGEKRVGRGGSFSVGLEKCRSAARSAAPPENKGRDLGFRICR